MKISYPSTSITILAQLAAIMPLQFHLLILHNFCAAVRVMLLTAIKEMRSGKGTSVNAIFTYTRSTYGYDLFKNRTHIRKTLAKLINEGLVEQVKGRGLAGSFRLGKNYKETKKMLAEASKFVRMKRLKYKCLMQKILLRCVI